MMLCSVSTNSNLEFYVGGEYCSAIWLDVADADVNQLLLEV